MLIWRGYVEHSSPDLHRWMLPPGAAASRLTNQMESCKVNHASPAFLQARRATISAAKLAGASIALCWCSKNLAEKLHGAACRSGSASHLLMTARAIALIESLLRTCCPSKRHIACYLPRPCFSVAPCQKPEAMAAPLAARPDKPKPRPQVLQHRGPARLASSWELCRCAVMCADVVGRVNYTKPCPACLQCILPTQVFPAG
jgi:hypothetical protein